MMMSLNTYGVWEKYTEKREWKRFLFANAEKSENVFAISI